MVMNERVFLRAIMPLQMWMASQFMQLAKQRRDANQALTPIFPDYAALMNFTKNHTFDENDQTRLTDI